MIWHMPAKSQRYLSLQRRRQLRELKSAKLHQTAFQRHVISYLLFALVRRNQWAHVSCHWALASMRCGWSMAPGSEIDQRLLENIQAIIDTLELSCSGR